MASSRSRVWLLLTLLVALLAVLHLQSMRAYAGGTFILPIDDAYIHLQYARQLARGQPLRYADGDPPSTGATSLLYPAVLAVGALGGLDGDGLARFSFALGALLFALSLALLHGLLLRFVAGDLALGGAILVALTGPIAWGFFSGMEIALVTFLFLLAASVIVRELQAGRLLWGGPCLGLLALSRPEAMVLACLAALALGAWGGSAARSRGARWGLLLPFAAALLVLGLQYGLTGHFHPNSSRPKSPLFTPWFSFAFLAQHASNWFAWVLRALLGGAAPATLLGPLNRIDAEGFVPWGALGLFLIGGPPRLAAELRERRLGVHALLHLWLLGGLALVGVTSGGANHHYRYLLPFLPVFVAYLVAGVETLGTALGRERGVERPVRHALLAFLVLMQCLTTVNFLLIYGQESHGYAYLRRAAEEAGGALPAGSRIAALDVGLLAYYGRQPVFDVYGLSSNEMTESTWYFADVMGSKWEVMRRLPAGRRPDWFFGFRERFEEYGDAGHLDPLRQELVRAFPAKSALHPAIGRDLALWRLHWEEASAADAPCSGVVRARIAGRTPIDALDVAHLPDQRGHRWRIDPLLPASFPANRAVRAACGGGPELVDGAVGVLVRERLEVSIARPQGLLLVHRSIGARSEVPVRWNGELLDEDEATRTGSGSGWRERMFRVAAASVHPGRNEVEAEGSYLSGYWWVYGEGEPPGARQD